MSQYVPPPTPKQAAEIRAQRISVLLWLVAVPPLVLALMIFGYSDQAPAFLRSLTIELDSLFGSPVWSFLNPAGAR
jgi:hypothetical protein